MSGSFLSNQLHRPADRNLDRAFVAIQILVMVQLFVFLRVEVFQVFRHRERHFFVFRTLTQVVEIGLNAQNDDDEADYTRDAESGDQKRMGFRPVEIGFGFDDFRGSAAWQRLMFVSLFHRFFHYWFLNASA